MTKYPLPNFSPNERTYGNTWKKSIKENICPLCGKSLVDNSNKSVKHCLECKKGFIVTGGKSA